MSTNLHGTVGVNSSSPAVVTFPRSVVAATVIISGASGAARVARNSDAPDAALDSCIPIGVPVTFEESGGLDSLKIYSNSGESLTYDVAINRIK